MKIKRRKPFLDFSHKAICLIICLLLIMLSVTGCRSLMFERSKPSATRNVSEKKDYSLEVDSDGQITDISLISALIDIINDNATFEEVYSAIPADLKYDLTLNDFSQFIDALEHPTNKRIIEFKKVSPAEQKQFSDDVKITLPSLAIEAENSEYYEIIYTKETEDTEAISTIIGIQHNETGKAYLSGTWIKEVNRIYQFSRWYFEAISTSDVGMLSWLLQQGYQEKNRDQIEDIEDNKARLLIDYYHSNIATEPLESVVHLLLPNIVEFHQELKIVSENQNKIRRCSFKQNNNLLTVSDPYPEQIKDQHLDLYYQDRFFFSWSVKQQYFSDFFNNNLGNPKIEEIEMQYPLEENSSFYRVTYDQLTILIRGEADSENNSWIGYIEQLELNEKSKDLSFGASKSESGALYSGMQLNDFYKNYPFSPEADYTIPGKQQGEKMALIVQVGTDSVSRIIMRVIYE